MRHASLRQRPEAPSYSTSAWTWPGSGLVRVTRGAVPSSRFIWSKSWINQVDCRATRLRAVRPASRPSRPAATAVRRHARGRPSSPPRPPPQLDVLRPEAQHEPDHEQPPVASAAATIASASSAVSAIGFSRRTCLPAVERPLGDVAVERRRQADVDGVHLRIEHRRVEIGGSARRRPFGHARGPLEGAPADGLETRPAPRALRSSPRAREPMKPAPMIAIVTIVPSPPGSAARTGAEVARLEPVVHVLHVAHEVDHRRAHQPRNSSPRSAVDSLGVPQTPPPSSSSDQKEPGVERNTGSISARGLVRSSGSSGTKSRTRSMSQRLWSIASTIEVSPTFAWMPAVPDRYCSASSGRSPAQ